MSKVFITGLGGQTASYLAEYVLSLGHEVHGIVRRNSVPSNQYFRLNHLGGRITAHYGDLNDAASIETVLRNVMPDYIFNLAAQSMVRISFDIPQYTMMTNAVGALNVLDAYKRICPEARFLQASSSEMFGLSVDADLYQRESTPMNPTSPYGCSKVAAYNLTRHYRRAYGLSACNSICFNHESPRRGDNFVSQKVVRGAVEISKRIKQNLELGNLEAQRDWGHAYDYCRAQWLIANHHTPDDFVVATGETHSVRNMCEIVFDYLGMDYQDYVIQNPKYMRSEELPYLRGDSTKIRTTLGWKPTYTFESMLIEMIEYWQKELS